MKFAIILFTLVLAGCCQDANASECNYINDQDQKYFCKATVDGDRNYCNYINNSDLKYACKAETSTTNNAECGYISNQDQKRLCEAKTKK